MVTALDSSITVSSLIQQVTKQIHQLSLPNIALIGVNTEGDMIAKRIQKNFEVNNAMTYQAVLDIKLYEKKNGDEAYLNVGTTNIPFRLTDKTVILVFDKIDSGENVISALSVLVDYGFPEQLKLCAPIVSKNIKYPILVEFFGALVEDHQNIDLELFEISGEDKILF